MTRPTTRSRGRSLHAALRLAPRDLIATSGLGSLALSRHRFTEALVLGREAHAISPTTALNYGVTGDALVELGRYPAAFKAFDRMATLRPGLSSYARVSHGLDLLGRVPEAIDTMQLAVQSSAGEGEPEAWARFQLGKLYWSIGRMSAAERQNRAALRAFPGYHYALDSLSRIEAAKGHNRAAIALEQQAVDRIPLPQYVAQLGDLYRVNGAGTEGAAAVRADRRDREAADRERRQDRSRDSSLRRRPRDPPAARSRTCAESARGAPLDRRRRRARLGALSQRPMQRGARPLQQALRLGTRTR